MGEFDAIRPYNDSEVPAVLARLLSDKAFLAILTKFRFPRLAPAFGWFLQPTLARKLRREFAGIDSVATLQDKVEYYVDTPLSAPPTASPIPASSNSSPAAPICFWPTTAIS